MTQLIIDNAAAISFDRDVTTASTTAADRELKWFRKGPIQSVAEVELNPMPRATYMPILAALSKDLLGPYNLKFPKEVVGDPQSGGALVVVSATLGDTDITLSAPSNDATINPGEIIKFRSSSGETLGSYTVIDAPGTIPVGETAEIVLDQPTFVNLAGTTLVHGSDAVFSMYLVSKPRASFGPTGLVAHDGPFRFVEVV